MCESSSFKTARDTDFTLPDINNVGSISQMLLAKGNAEYDDAIASQWQSTQVSVISVANCLGRILIGPFMSCYHSQST
jgi:hypothetical protein